MQSFSHAAKLVDAERLGLRLVHCLHDSRTRSQSAVDLSSVILMLFNKKKEATVINVAVYGTFLHLPHLPLFISEPLLILYVYRVA